MKHVEYKAAQVQHPTSAYGMVITRYRDTQVEDINGHTAMAKRLEHTTTHTTLTFLTG